MGSRHRDRSSRDRDRDGKDKDRDRDRERDRDRDRDRGRHDRDKRRDKSPRERKSRDLRSRDRDRDRRSRDRDRRSRDRDRDREHRERRSRDKESISKNADVTMQLALLDSMVGTATTTSRNFTGLLAATTAATNGCTNTAPHVETAEEARLRRKRSRWGGGEHDKTFIPGMPTILPSTMSAEQQEAYLVQLQIEEVSRKLRSGDLGIPANVEERSPSPEPIYSYDGKRLNTREFRTRRRLEEQRHQLILRMQCINPEFKPPSDYKPPTIRVSDKVLIPQEEYPDVNFVGLIIGPRGNTLKFMEKETGAKIIIRGKGSVKEGKVGRKDGQPLPGEDEPLHAFITASNPKHVKKAVDKIKEVIRQGIEVPDGHNDLRRMQLRELAQLNGTLREPDGPRCTNCGSTEHKSWLCPDKPNVTNNIVCSSCGGAGHIARDCRSKRPGMGGPPAPNAQAKIDEEYLSLMAELGETPPGSDNPQLAASRSAINKNRSIFDKRPGVQRAIMAPPPQPQGMPANMAPPPWGSVAQWNNMPPPPGGPVTIPPLLPWMNSNNQPPPPGSGPGPEAKLPPPPGSVSPSLPPPMASQPPTATSTTPSQQTMPPTPMAPAPWQMPPPFPWQQGGYMGPPGTGPNPMNPLAGLPNLLAPPPPPPPS